MNKKKTKKESESYGKKVRNVGIIVILLLCFIVSFSLIENLFANNNRVKQNSRILGAKKYSIQYTPEAKSTPPTSAGIIWNPPTTSSTRPGGVSGALWASKPLCSPTSPPIAGGHDPLLIPLYGAFSVFRCVRAYKESRLLRTHVRSKTPKFSFIGGWQSVRLTVCQER